MNNDNTFCTTLIVFKHFLYNTFVHLQHFSVQHLCPSTALLYNTFLYNTFLYNKIHLELAQLNIRVIGGPHPGNRPWEGSPTPLEPRWKNSCRHCYGLVVKVV